MALQIVDVEVYSGLEIIASKFPEACVRSQLGCLSVPEALQDTFMGPEIATLSSLGWEPDFVYGGFYYNVSGYLYVPPVEE